MKKIIALLFICISLLLIVTACGKQDETTSEVNFEEALSQEDYKVDVMGINGEIHFDNDGIGTLTVGDSANRFSYTVSNVSDDGTKADVTVDDTGYSQIDGKTIKAQIVDDGLKVTYSGMSYTLKGISPDSY